VKRQYCVCIAGFVLACSIFTGCDVADKKASDRLASEEGAPASPVVAAQDVALLEEVAAKIERSSNGLVKSVDLRGIDVNDELAQTLSALDSLEKLTISDSSMSDEGWKALGQLSKLQQLDLRECPVDNDELKLAVSGMPNLRALRLSGKSGKTTVDDIGLAVLAGCPELKALAIDGLWVTVDGISQLAENNKLAELYAAGTALDDDAMLLLAKFPMLKKLRLAQTSVGTTGLQALSQLPIEDLDVSECSGVTDECLEFVGSIKSLKRLNLWRDNVSDEGVAALAGLTNLEWLNLDNTRVTDTGLQSLSSMKKLAFLHLGSTGVTNDGMPALTELTALRDLKVTRTAVTDVGVQTLKQTLPELSVQLIYLEGQ
jgi:Leucine-rich repeat (LRR) protein